MGQTGPVQMGYRARSFLHIQTMGQALFLENIFTGQIFLSFILMHYFLLILDNICADKKDNPMASCKNRLIKKCLRDF